MARDLGYGGLANTIGGRDFSGKEEAEADPAQPIAPQFIQMQILVFLSALGGAVASLFKH